MFAKCFEVRDRMTLVPVVALQTVPGNKAQRFLLRQPGYGFDLGQAPTVIVRRLSDCKASSNAHEWGGRTMPDQDHFEQLEDGAVVDVEFILGEKKPTPVECDAALWTVAGEPA